MREYHGASAASSLRPGSSPRVTSASLALVVVAAALHAAWNALAKRGGDPLTFLWLSNSVATLLLLLPAVSIVVADGFVLSALPLAGATIGLHAIYFYALGRAYQSGAYSVVYPMARGLGVALVPGLALSLFGERVSPLGGLGVALVVAGIIGLHAVPRPAARDARRPRLGSASGWAFLTGLTIAGYSVVDKALVSHISPFLGMGLIEAGTTVLLLPAIRRRAVAVSSEWRQNRRAVLIAGSASPLAYLLVLFAFRMSKTSYVVAARELSIVLSAVIGSVWLDEGRLGPRLVGAGVVLAGVACVAVAR